MLTKDMLKVIVDKVFAAIEAREAGHSIVVGILKSLNAVVDDVLLDEVLASLPGAAA